MNRGNLPPHPPKPPPGPPGHPRSKEAAEVIAWLNADPTRTRAQASALFGHSDVKIRKWISRHRERERLGVTAPATENRHAPGTKRHGPDRDASRASRSAPPKRHAAGPDPAPVPAPSPAPAPGPSPPTADTAREPGNVVRLAPPPRTPPPPPLPTSPDAALRGALRTSILRRLRWLGTEESLESPHQRAVASALGSLVACKDAILELGVADPAPAADGPDPSTPEGEAALVERLGSLPPHLLAAAMDRMRTG